ncbi:cytochrome P450 family protein [Streptomyces sp. NRRL S-340]|uniref:cytochrome P450 family protein n=1 Tax=Streptomyces sp. NRRL S-340 TaxID=1463901 RepID=UPI00056B2ABD|nr:cytochrome P450 [Streptomyces sp. NRRL S-340]
MTRQQQCPYAIDPSGRDIHGEAARLSAQGPLTRVVLPGGVEAWWVTGQEAIRKLLIDPRISKDAYRHWPAWINGEIGETWPLAIWVSVQNMVTAYGDDHKRLRALVASAFTTRRVARLRPRVEEITQTLLDELARADDGRPVDFRGRFAHLLPTRVLSELFGIPEEFRASLHRIISGFFDTTASLEAARRNQVDLYRTMGDLVAIKRDTPGEDLTSSLIAARDERDGSRLSEKELVDNLILLFTAGYETTVNLLDNALCLLLANPEQLARVRAGRATWADAVEEALRVEAPGANGILRYAVEDVAVGDTVIGKGEPLVISFAAAGRDRAVHGDDADRFDVTRATRREHLAFGHGAHFCVGAQLARMEAEIALRGLFDRFPEAALAVPAGELRPLGSFISNGHREVPLLLGRQRAGVSAAGVRG